VPLPVFKTALGFARGLVGSIPIFSRQIGQAMLALLQLQRNLVRAIQSRSRHAPL
jgi:hypothetical protein